MALTNIIIKYKPEYKNWIFMLDIFFYQIYQCFSFMYFANFKEQL